MTHFLRVARVEYGAANADPYSTRAYEPDPVVLDSIKKSCNKKLQYLISKSAILSDINDVIVCI